MNNKLRGGAGSDGAILTLRIGNESASYNLARPGDVANWIRDINDIVQDHDQDFEALATGGAETDTDKRQKAIEFMSLLRGRGRFGFRGNPRNQIDDTVAKPPPVQTAAPGTIPPTLLPLNTGVSMPKLVYSGFVALDSDIAAVSASSGAYVETDVVSNSAGPILTLPEGCTEFICTHGNVQGANPAIVPAAGNVWWNDVRPSYGPVTDPTSGSIVSGKAKIYVRWKIRSKLSAATVAVSSGTVKLPIFVYAL